MALVIPTAQTTYGDATTVPGDVFSSYLLAQFPEDAALGWVAEVRALCAVDELKWKVFQSRRERLQSKGPLWTRITRSLQSATIVVIKPTLVESEVRHKWLSQGAEEGIDFDQTTLISECATALIADTPVAYLPNQLSQALGLYPAGLFLEFDRFVPENIKQRIGGGLRDAKVFAARAHATFDVCASSETNRRTLDGFRQPGAHLVLRELLATRRGFDVEHAPSAKVLNEAADTIASSLAEALLLPGEISSEPLVREFSSRDVDVLQAADIAAGWAHELVALGNERALGATFGRVLINGVPLA